MKYLYGDSTSSPLELNYIRLLRDALDFSVAVLLASQRIRKWVESERERELAADGEIERIEDLGKNLVGVLEGAAQEGDGTATGRCANAIARSASDAVGAEVAGVKAALGDDVARIRGHIADERGKCVAALETLILSHDIPDTDSELRLAANETGYGARLRGMTKLGLETVLELDVPDSNLFSSHVRVDKVVDDLEIHAPEKRGWLSKKVKLVTHKLSKKYIVELSHAASATTLKLRSTPVIDESGFDIVFPGDEPGVRITPVHKGEDEHHAPYEVSEGDSERLCALLEKISAPTRALLTERRSMTAATFEGTALSNHENPALLVERLIVAMTPVVREISRHSLQADEFVLKRALDDDRREEIFVPKRELRAKLDALPPGLRKMFDPLGLGPAPGKAGKSSPAPKQTDDEIPTAVAGPPPVPQEDSKVDNEWLDNEDSGVDQAIRSLETDGVETKPR